MLPDVRSKQPRVNGVVVDPSMPVTESPKPVEDKPQSFFNWNSWWPFSYFSKPAENPAPVPLGAGVVNDGSIPVGSRSIMGQPPPRSAMARNLNPAENMKYPTRNYENTAPRIFPASESVHITNQPSPHSFNPIPEKSTNVLSQASPEPAAPRFYAAPPPLPLKCPLAKKNTNK